MIKLNVNDIAFQSCDFWQTIKNFRIPCLWLVAWGNYYFLWAPVQPIRAQVHNKDGLISSMAVSINLKLERCASSRRFGFFCLCSLTKMLSCVILCGINYGEIWIQWLDIYLVTQGECDNYSVGMWLTWWKMRF